MPEYVKPTQDDIENGRVCVCCKHDEAPVHPFSGNLDFSKPERPGGPKSIDLFCEICASTFLSHCVSYPRLYGEHQHLFSSLGWIANELKLGQEAILAEVRALRSLIAPQPPPEPPKQ